MGVKFGDLLSHKYQITEKIGEGVTSNIFTAVDRNERVYAVKVEKHKSGALLKEVKAYEKIQHDEHGRRFPGIPRMFYFGWSNGHNFIAMELLGGTVFDKMKRGICCVKTVLMIAIRVISILEHVHNRGFVHHDVKPSNILTGLGYNNEQIYLVDYGLAERYRNRETNLHLECNDGAGLVGTIRYASVNVLQGIQGSRKDDLESLAYSLFELRWGYLPWKKRSAGLEYTAYKEYVLQKKREIDIKDFSFRIPGLKEYMRYVKELEFKSRPHYPYLRQCFEDGLKELGYENDGKFEWIK